jgi:putative flippase GtrA
MIKKLWSLTILRYCLIGGIAYAIELSFLIGLHSGLNLQRTIAAGIAFWLGIFVSFFLQKLFAFRDYNKERGAIAKQGSLYAGLVAWNYFVTLLIVSLLPSTALVYSRTFALLLTTAWNFLIYRHFIFSEDSSFNLNKTIGWFPRHKKTILFVTGLSIPVLAFFYKYLATSNRMFVGDFDYYAQMYEAFRISVLHFHQFPLWNPWMSGGLPLFANPQFGLVSIQSLLVLLFGTIYGLKLAYVSYALAGFWGMYVLGRKVANASPLRSALVSYIWIFGGFFASHGIYHFTFTSFFLLPWVVYFIATHKQKKAWLGLAITMSVIILSSVHYAFLFLALTTGLLFLIMLTNASFSKKEFVLTITKTDFVFLLKFVGLTVVLCGYRFITTYAFVSQNQRPASLFHESPNSLFMLLKATFLPLGNRFLSIPGGLQWPWGEYSMYVGMGVTIAIIVLVVDGIYKRVKKHRLTLRMPKLMYAIAILGLVGLLLALGDFSKLSPYHLLHIIPGFGQMRVASRWVIVFVFSILVGLMASRSHQRIINILLAIAVVELFLTYGPPKNIGNDTLHLPKTSFDSTFKQIDNNERHAVTAHSTEESYYFSTLQNEGQIYSDDSIIDTLDHVLGTNRCGVNVRPSCTLIMSHNARVEYWSPNKIILRRTATGPIELNMNVERGWQVNDHYIFPDRVSVNPASLFILPDSGTQTYELEYASKLSPAWFAWEAELRL